MKRILYTIVGIMLCMTAGAQTSLQEQINDATDGATISLIEDVDLSISGLSISKNITLDLNGHTLKVGESASSNIQVISTATFTLKDSSTGKTGKLYTEDPYASGHANGVIHVYGAFVLESGHIEAVMSDASNKGQFGVVMDANGKVTINGGEIKAGWYAISGNGNNSGNSVIVNDGTLISTADYAIYNPAKNSSVTIENGVIYGQAGAIAMNAGTLTVNGGTITSKGQGSTGTWGDGTGGLNNAAINVNAKYANADAKIIGGKIIAEGNAVVLTTGTTYTGTIQVSGGEFSSPIPEQYCADGFIPEDNGDGTFGVKEGTYVAQIGENKYETLAAAVEAATDEQKITLLDDITISEVLKISKSVTLDLNGNVITANKMIYVNGDGKNVTIKDSKATVAPTVDADNNVNYTSGKITTAGSIFYIYNNATLTLESGTLESTGSYPIYIDDNNAATFTMNGGYLHGDEFAICPWASTTININGGVVKSDDQAAISGNGTAQWSTAKGTTVNVTGGTIIAKSKSTADLSCGIYNPQSGVVNISGGTIYADNGAGVVMRAGDLNITGGSIITTGSGEGYVGDAKINVPMSAVVVDVDAKYPCNTLNDLNVAITGGTLTSADGVDAITILNEEETKTTTDIVSVSGATLSGPIYTTETFSMTDAEVPFAFDNYRVKKAEYTREGVSTTTWGTVCLPFSITAEENGYKYYTPTSVTSNELTITEITEFPIAAGTPVIFQKGAGEVVITSSEAIVSKTATAGSGTGTLALVGTFENKTITTGLENIYYINGDKFHQAKASLTVPAYRAYINYSGSMGQKPAVLSLFIGEDETTDIKTIATDVKTSTYIHDVNGRLLSAPQKGLNIVKLANGKTVKLIVK